MSKSKFRGFIGKRKTAKDLVPVEKHSKSTRTTEESLPIDLPQSAMVNVVAFRGFIKAELKKIENKNIGLRWLDTLKAKSVVKNQRAFLGEIRNFEQEVTAWIKDQTERTTAETARVEAETEKKIAEHGHLNIEKTLLIQDKEQDVKIAELDRKIAEEHEKKRIARTQKPPESPIREEGTREEAPQKTLGDELSATGEGFSILRDRIRLEKDQIELQWQRLCIDKRWDPTDKSKVRPSQHEEWQREFNRKEYEKDMIEETLTQRFRAKG